MLLQAGAGLEVTDSLGNTPLHNAVLYYPSNQQTVDMLLEKGADVSAKNYEGSTPVILADDKDLKQVLKELKKAVGRKKFLAATGYTNSPEMRRKVFDRRLVEERNKQRIIVRYNSPVVVNSPGLLKRKRETEEMDESFCGRRKRIRWCEQDSTGADIDHQFSEDERETELKSKENYFDNNVSEDDESKLSHEEVEETDNGAIVEASDDIKALSLGTVKEDLMKEENYATENVNLRPNLELEELSQKEESSQDEHIETPSSYTKSPCVDLGKPNSAIESQSSISGPLTTTDTDPPSSPLFSKTFPVLVPNEQTSLGMSECSSSQTRVTCFGPAQIHTKKDQTASRQSTWAKVITEPSLTAVVDTKGGDKCEMTVDSSTVNGEDTSNLKDSENYNDTQPKVKFLSSSQGFGFFVA